MGGRSSAGGGTIYYDVVRFFPVSLPSWGGKIPRMGDKQTRVVPYRPSTIDATRKVIASCLVPSNRGTALYVCGWVRGLV